MEEPLTRTEKRRLAVNLCIRAIGFGLASWEFVAYPSRRTPVGDAIYAFICLVLLFGPAILLAGWIYERRRGPGG